MKRRGTETVGYGGNAHAAVIEHLQALIEVTGRAATDPRLTPGCRLDWQRSHDLARELLLATGSPLAPVPDRS